MQKLSHCEWIFLMLGVLVMLLMILVGLDPKSLSWGWCLAFLEVNLQLSNSFLHKRREKLRYLKAHWEKNNKK